MNEKLKIFTDVSPLREGKLKNLSPLLAHHWQGLDKGAIFSGEYNVDSPFRLAGNPVDADFVALPMHWSYYLWNDKNKMHEAFELAEVADRYSKPLIVWFKGDLVPVTPFANQILFLPGVVRKSMKNHFRSCPVFIDDPESLYGKAEVLYRKRPEKPLVGFCGYGSISTVKLGWSIAAGLYSNATQRLGRSDFEEAPIVPATTIRNRAMKYLARHSDIETSFKIRPNYTSKQPISEPTESSRSFFDNIYGTDYTLCVRGYGNWSYRFYETLACGRIPVFVDTECVLPLESHIDWRRYCVWVDRSELHLIGEKVLAFHSTLRSADFVDLQIECRRLWENHLSLNGCMKNIRDYLKKSAPIAPEPVTV